MTIFRIDHPKGFLALRVEEFFPCAEAKARKLFPFIIAWTTPDQQQELHAYLQEQAKVYKKNKDVTHYKRTMMNIRYLEKGGACRAVSAP